MNYGKTSALLIAVLIATAALVFAEGNVERGKKLFNDPSLGGSTNAKNCASCHPGGQGLEQAGTKTDFSSFGTKDLKDVVNACIKAPLRGNPLDKNSQDMEDIVTYIKSLGK